MNASGVWRKLNKDTQLRRINETFRVLYRSNVKLLRPKLNKIGLIRQLECRKNFVRMSNMMKLSKIFKDETNF